ncbi:MAG: exopolyphosphatase [Calditrichaceae bacterium]
MIKFAAIDIGSNAVRLLFSQVFPEYDPPVFKKISLIRMPLRLGNDAFIDHKISPEKSRKLIQTMQGFRHLIDSYEPVDYMACATSALRESENGPDLAIKIKELTGINIEIIDGKREAEIIYYTHIAESLQNKIFYIYLDVGGGSTEITFFKKSKVTRSASFNIGAIRLLNNLVPETAWQEMKMWLKENVSGEEKINIIGSGGNINKLYRLANQKNDKPLSYNKLKRMESYLRSFSTDERVKNLGLRPDRADVIIPATKIYLSVMKWAKASHIYVPQIGLADGMIHVIYGNHKPTNA